tara:strand:+ start:3642 stop:4220 length:579 start_codon:yes stop_codon:yes gene_type:complete
MKTLIENWNKFVNEQETETDKFADILSKFKSIQGDSINAGQLKFLVRFIAKDIASGGKLGKQLETAAIDAGVDIASFATGAIGFGLVRSGAKLVSNVSKRAKLNLKDDAQVIASLMLVDDVAASKNPILNLLNVHDAYEGSINPLLNGPFVSFAMEQLQSLGDDQPIPKNWGTDTMQKYLATDFKLQSKPME